MFSFLAGLEVAKKFVVGGFQVALEEMFWVKLS